MSDIAENKLHDIATEADVAVLVSAFYTKVRQDELLFPIFDPIIKNDWDTHLQRMTDFWSTLLLYTHKFSDDPLTKHLPMPLEKIHFDRWLQLFNETVNELFEGPIAHNAPKRAESIARIMKTVKKISQ